MSRHHENRRSDRQTTMAVADAQWTRWMVGLLAGLAVLAMLVAAVPARAQDVSEGFADLAERLLPAVVNISTTQTVAAADGPDIPEFQVPEGSPFEEFFRDFFDQQQRRDRSPRQATSLGSGFVIDVTNGYVVTNNHVIDGADEITVILNDNTSLDATVVGRDERTDIAVLQVDPVAGMTAVDWGVSDDMRVGDWVVAIGNPFGLGGTVTAGIVSARSRDINAGPYDDFIQTDASINRGNSGGPMFNLDGDVIGINTAIFSPSGGSVGIGFAIPSALAEPVVDQLIEFGRTRRGWLGVQIQQVTTDIADSLGLDDPRGALVARVTPGGPAEAAGIEAGDIILTFNGRPVSEMRRLPRIVAETRIGRTVPVEVWRRNRVVTIDAVVGELEEAEAAGLLDPNSRGTDQDDDGGADDGVVLGMTLRTVDDDLSTEYDLADGQTGVVIIGLEDDSPGVDKGMRPGDVIIEINQETVATPADVSAKVDAARDAGRGSVLMLISRQGDLRFIAVSIM